MTQARWPLSEGRTHDDIRQAIDVAREHDLVLSVRSGGHSGPGFGTNDGGVVLDLTLIDQVEVIDADRRIVRIGSARWTRFFTVFVSGTASTQTC